MQLNRNPRNFFAETEQVMVGYYFVALALEPLSSDIYSSNLDILFAVSTSQMIRSFKVASFPTLTPSLTATVGPISSSFLSTNRGSPFTITTVMALVSYAAETLGLVRMKCLLYGSN